MENVTQKTEKSISGAIKIDEKEIGDHLNQLVRQSVEDTINSLLDAEADAICNATRYQHSPDRLDSRAGSYKRKLLTTSGEVELTVPRLRRLPFETQIIQRYQTKQSSVEAYIYNKMGNPSVSLHLQNLRTRCNLMEVPGSAFTKRPAPPELLGRSFCYGCA